MKNYTLPVSCTGVVSLINPAGSSGYTFVNCGIEMGINALIMKPIVMGELALKIRDALEPGE